MNLVLYPEKQSVQVCLLDGEAPARQAQVPARYGDLPALADDVADTLGADRWDRVICPGGALKPLMAGVYRISDAALEAAAGDTFGAHRYNRAMELCRLLADRVGAAPLMAHPLSCDELTPLNRTSSLREVHKRSRYYALEHRAALHLYGGMADLPPEDMNAIVCRVDDDVSVGAHLRGACIEVNDALGLEGPMGFRCAGDVPVAKLTALFFQEDSDLQGLTRRLREDGGVWGYAGTDDPAELETRIAGGDTGARTAAEAVAYQTAKWVGMCAFALQGRVDAVLVTGKGARSGSILAALRGRVQAIAPVVTVEPDHTRYLGRLAHAAATPLCPILQY